MATSSIHEMLSTELTKLALLDVDKSKFTNWKEEKTHKTMLPGMFLPLTILAYFADICKQCRL